MAKFCRLTLEAWRNWSLFRCSRVRVVGIATKKMRGRDGMAPSLVYPPSVVQFTFVATHRKLHSLGAPRL